MDIGAPVDARPSREPQMLEWEHRADKVAVKRLVVHLEAEAGRLDLSCKEAQEELGQEVVVEATSEAAEEQPHLAQMVVVEVDRPIRHSQDSH